jgi:hypothetical protein
MRGTGKDFCQLCGTFSNVCGWISLEHARIDADVGDTHAAAMLPPGQQQMRRLAAEERHGLTRVDRNAHHGAGRAVDPARQVDGEHGAPLALIASIISSGSPFTGR